MTHTKKRRPTWQKMVAIEYKRWLDNGGAKKKKGLRIAAFDRICDKWRPRRR